jgi:hypothetical protein
MNWFLLPLSNRIYIACAGNLEEVQLHSLLSLNFCVVRHNFELLEVSKIRQDIGTW